MRLRPATAGFDDSDWFVLVHTTVDVSLQEAWAKTPTGKKRETTHVIRCETEILRLKTG